MIAFLTGKILLKRPTEIVLDVNGVGYRIFISLQSYEKIGETGTEFTIQTYLNVREDALQLYGFSTELEHELFLHLISVNGIGPKVAMSILSATKADEFIQYVSSSNLRVLTTLPGIGKKTAERLIVELKDKLAKLSVGSSTTSLPAQLNQDQEDAVSALIALGFSRLTAEKSVASILKEHDQSIAAEEIIRIALRQNIK